MRPSFDLGTVIVSIDAEQIWGYLDMLSEAQFQERYPNAVAAHDKLLDCLCAAGVRATWLVVGGMTLSESAGPNDPRMDGLPHDWVRAIPSGGEATAPLWFRPSFVERLRDANPVQEIGLHAGLTHLVWTDERATPELVKRELSEGVNALNRLGVQPRTFSFGRDREAFHELLPGYGIRCFRSRPPTIASRLGRTIPGALWRASDELRRGTPPPIWPKRQFPGLWNLPASMFFYPIGPARARILGLRSRVARFRRGLEAAARHCGIFHFCLHPENLAESPHGFSIFEEMLESLILARDRGDIEVVPVNDLVDGLEKDQTHASRKRHSHENLLATGGRS